MFLDVKFSDPVCNAKLAFVRVSHFLFFILQKEGETSELEKGAVKAVQDLYDVVCHDVLSIDLRSVKVVNLYLCVYNISLEYFPTKLLSFVVFRVHYKTWNLLSKARTEGRLFSKLKWPKDADMVCSRSFILFLCISIYFDSG